ncbi:MAG: peptide deformylase [Lachnospiraceae bacterium]|nr:peptide deformylase [Lachnospiraceae bacterium]
MAIRKIREWGDEVLNTVCRPVTKMTEHLGELIDDMLETMYESSGVGLAAPQVGVLKRVVVIDVSEDRNEPYVLINPRILESSGEQTGYEGCLSVPNKIGEVTRPAYVKVAALDRDMKEFELEGTEMMARCLCHELDHLDGIMYVSKTEGPLQDSRVLEEQETEE